MEDFLNYILLREPNVRYVVLGSILFGASTAVVGSFAFLRKRSLIGDAVGHSVLPGICLAFIIFQTKNLLVLLVGAALTGWLAIIAIDFITTKTRIKSDAAIGLVLSVFFGLGILLLTVIQGSGNAEQAGLNVFLFGQAASIGKQDTLTFLLVSVILLASVLLFYKEFKIVSFDRDYAQASGTPVRRIEILLSFLTVLAVAAGIQSVGAVLMAAMLITPAVAARYWTDNLKVIVILAAIVGAVSGVLGAYISGSAVQMPTGPWIIVVASIIAVLSVLFAPKRGVVAKQMKLRRNRLKILEENVLKMFFHIGEQVQDYQTPRFMSELLKKRPMSEARLRQGLRRLVKKGLLRDGKNAWTLTDEGLKEAKRIIKLHRLWELYLTKYLRIAEDHVHDDAEAIEHVITPELEKRLEELLEYPELDPHGKPINIAS